MKLLYFLPLLIVSVVSCNGQNKTHTDETSQQEIVPDQTTKIVKTQGTNKYANIQCGLQDKAGNIWFGTMGEGVYRYDGRYFTQFTVENGLTNNVVWSILEDNGGNIWFGTNYGICRYNGQTLTTVPIVVAESLYMPFDTSPNYDPSAKNEVWSMMKDKSGKLWFGTRNGLYCYDGNLFTRFLDNDKVLNKDSLRLVMVECMLEDKNGIIWIGSGMIPGNEGICRYDPASGMLTAFKPDGDGWIRYMLEDKSGNIWIGTRHAGIWHYDGRTFSRFKVGNNIGLTALVDKTGNIWFSGGEKDGYASDGGVQRYNGKSLEGFPEDSLGGYSVWCMLQDGSGNIWFGTRNIGLYRYDGKSFTNFSE